MEIERKWLVDKDRCPGLVLYNSTIFKTEQGYLNTINDEWLIRVRKFEEKGTISNPGNGKVRYYLELKTQGLLSREEIKFIIKEDEYENALSKCLGIVRKTRYCWLDTVYYEVDIYDNHDFVTCEVEFPTEEEANNFVAPDWCIEDITYDPKYKNINLTTKNYAYL